MIIPRIQEQETLGVENMDMCEVAVRARGSSEGICSRQRE